MKHLTFFIFFQLISSVAYCQIELTKDYTLSTLLISTQNENEFGTGIFYRDSSSVYLITAKHVLQDTVRYDSTNYVMQLKKGILSISYFSAKDIEKNSSKKDIVKIDLDVLNKAGYIRLHPRYDIGLIKVALVDKEHANSIYYIGDHLSGIHPDSTKAYTYAKKDIAYFKDVVVSREVFVFGYPRTIGLQKNSQYDFDIPLIQKGIISAKNYKKATYVVNCSVYGGNSGGPVITIDPNGKDTISKIAGIVTEYIPYLNRQNSILFNSGYSVVVPIEYALDLIPLIVK